jgi:hypothetical protein
MNLSLNILLLPRKDEWTLHIKQCNLDNKGYFNIKWLLLSSFFFKLKIEMTPLCDRPPAATGNHWSIA